MYLFGFAFIPKNVLETGNPSSTGQEIDWNKK